MLWRIHHSDGIAKPRLLWTLPFDDGPHRYFCVLESGRVNDTWSYGIYGIHGRHNKLTFQTAVGSLQIPGFHSEEGLQRHDSALQSAATVEAGHGGPEMFVDGHSIDSARLDPQLNLSKVSVTRRDMELLRVRKLVLSVRIMSMQGALSDLQGCQGESLQEAWAHETEEYEALEASLLLLDMQIATARERAAEQWSL